MILKGKVVSIFCFFFIATFGQDGGSVYSSVGLGLSSYKGNADIQAMQGFLAVRDSLSVNYYNPSSLASLRVSNYAIGVSTSWLNQKSKNASSSIYYPTVDYFTFGIPLSKKSGFSAGLLVDSSVTYNIKINDKFENNAQVTQLFGKGGVYKGGLNYGIELFKNLRLGASLEYYFGEVEFKKILSIANVQYSSRFIRQASINGLGYKLSVFYMRPLKEHLEIEGGVVLHPNRTIKSTNNLYAATITLQSSGDEIVQRQDDTSKISYDRGTDINYSLGYDASVALTHRNKWQVGMQYSLLPTLSYSNAFFPSISFAPDKSYALVLAGFYIPKYNSFNNYFNRIRYRGGLRYEDSKLATGFGNITTIATSIGFGIPLGVFSTINLGLEYLNRGSAEGTLAEENAFRFQVGFSLSDLWFIKRKYN